MLGRNTIFCTESVLCSNFNELKRFSEAENKNSAERSEDVGNNCVVSFLLGTFSFLCLANKEKKMYK
jgi:hypothetical protein